MFDFRDYVKKGFISAVGKMDEYKIRLNSAGWYDKGVLTDEDMQEIDGAINAQSIAEPEFTEDDI